MQMKVIFKRTYENIISKEDYSKDLSTIQQSSKTAFLSWKKIFILENTNGKEVAAVSLNLLERIFWAIQRIFGREIYSEFNSVFPKCRLISPDNFNSTIQKINSTASRIGIAPQSAGTNNTVAKDPQKSIAVKDQSVDLPRTSEEAPSPSQPTLAPVERENPQLQIQDSPPPVLQTPPNVQNDQSVEQPSDEAKAIASPPSTSPPVEEESPQLQIQAPPPSPKVVQTLPTVQEGDEAIQIPGIPSDKLEDAMNAAKRLPRGDVRTHSIEQILQRYVDSGQYQKVIEHRYTITSSSKYIGQIVQKHLDANALDQALGTIKHLDFEGRAPFANALIQKYLAVHEPNKAKEAMDFLSFQESMPGRELIAREYLSLGNLNEAMEMADYLPKETKPPLMGEIIQAYINVGMYEEALKNCYKTSSPEEYKEQIVQKHLSTDQLEEALILARDLRDKEKTQKYCCQIARSYFLKKEYKNIEKALNYPVENVQRDVLYEEFAKVCCEVGEYAQAVAFSHKIHYDLKTSREETATNRICIETVAENYLKEGNLEKASEIFDYFKNNGQLSGLGDLSRKIGAAYIEQDQLDKAAEALDKWAYGCADPIYVRLAAKYLSKGELKKARFYCYFPLRENYAELKGCYIRIAQACKTTNNQEEFQKTIRCILENPHLVDSENRNLAEIATDFGNWDKAFEYILNSSLGLNTSY